MNVLIHSLIDILATDQIHWVLNHTITIPNKAQLKKENDSHRELLYSFCTELLAVLCIDFSNPFSCNSSNKLDMDIFVNSCPENQCKTPPCLKQCIPKIKSDMESKFGSAPSLLNVTASNGTNLSGSIQFCSFDPVISGKRDELKQNFFNNHFSIYFLFVFLSLYWFIHL